jgi:hypothetical protein
VRPQAGSRKCLLTHNTVIKVRNSWSTQFGLNGDYLLHASTLNYLAGYYDYKTAAVA